MSVKLVSLIFEADIPDLSYTKHGQQRCAKASTVTLLLLAYADHANDEGEGAYPGYDRLQRKTKLSRQGIADTLDAIKQADLMTFTGVSRKGTNTYRINRSALQELVKPLDSELETRVKPLDSAESSHLTQPSQATGLKPSFNHPLTVREERAPNFSTPDFVAMTVNEAKKLPTLRLYTRATGFWPGSLVWEYVHGFIVQHNLTEEKLRAAATAWAASGFKAENVKGVLEWAAFGIPEKYRQTQGGESGKTWTPIPDAEQTRKMLDEKWQKPRQGKQSIQDVMGQLKGSSS